jgi:uncharacterized phage protein gp47/JayE
VIDTATPRLDQRDTARVFEQLLARRAGYVPEWLAADKSAGAALGWIFSRYLYTVLQRLNQAPDKNELAFFDLLGLELVAPQSARAPVTFQLSAQASSGSAPAATAVAAPAPPGSTEQIVFETERAVGVMAGGLPHVVSLWPGRDEYIDHSASITAHAPFQPFLRKDLQPTPHALYLSHATLLALTGNVDLGIEFELTHPASEPLEVLWEYWDGQVWRQFLEDVAGCDPIQRALRDSTNGLTSSGSVRLRADAAKAAQTIVAGNTGYWVRGRLAEPLPADPGTLLPDVESVRLSTTVSRPLNAGLLASPPYSMDIAGISGVLRNEAGEPVAGATVVAVSLDDANPAAFSDVTGSDGRYRFESAALDNVYQFDVHFAQIDATVTPREQPSSSKRGMDLTLIVDGVKPDKAFADGTALDVTKPFYPLGLQPQPGSTFYFSSAEIFSKPGATFRIWMARSKSPQDEAGVAVSIGSTTSQGTRLNHLLVWEYWNGAQWVALAMSTSLPPSLDLDVTELVEFVVPADMAPTKVNDQEALWIRVRLMSGSFGFSQFVTWTAGHQDNSFTYVVAQPPALATFRMGYSWEHGPFHPDQVLTYNDFRYEDRTYESKWPGRTFAPFSRVSDVTPTLYLGFDKKPPVDLIGLYIDVVEDRADSRGPVLIWEYWNGVAWRPLSVDDETRHLRVPGIASFIAADDSAALARFGTSLYWVRARLREDGPPGAPTINAIYPNTVWAAQVRTLTDVPLGATSGMPSEVLPIVQIPVLAGEVIEVRERVGQRANVEWRILALEVTGGDRRSIDALEAQLAQEGLQTDVVYEEIRLRRDRRKKVSEVWVRWRARRNLFFSGPEDRHYTIDRVRGRLIFGDGTNGKIPPPGASILARRLRTGGGTSGNVALRKITQLLGVVPGIESVFNPRPAEGGANTETLEQYRVRAPRTLRHRGRAITLADYETLAREASAAVASARAIPAMTPSGRRRPGAVTVVIIPYSRDIQPWPSWGLRDHVARFIAERAPATSAAAARIYVTGPEYLPIGVSATIAPVDADQAGTVEKRAREALLTFLHPLAGGPDGGGWPAGRAVFLSDVAAVVERVEGVDYVEELALLHNSVAQGVSVAVAPQQVVVAGTIELRLKRADPRVP